jgi:ABC-type sugar transport system ATPase subunit
MGIPLLVLLVGLVVFAACGGVRPQDVEGVAALEADLTGRIEVVEPMGSTVLVHAGREAGPGFRALLAADSELSVGQPLPVRFPPDRLHFFDAKTGGRLGCSREGGGL